MTSLRHVRTAAGRLSDLAETRDAQGWAWTFQGLPVLAVTGMRGAERLVVQLAPAEVVKRVCEVPGAVAVGDPGRPHALEVALGDVNGMVANALLGAAHEHRAGPSAATVGSDDSDLPRIGRPATRALAGHGVTQLADLARHSRAEVLALHGLGPRAVALLDAALVERGLTWRDQAVGAQQTP